MKYKVSNIKPSPHPKPRDEIVKPEIFQKGVVNIN